MERRDIYRIYEELARQNRLLQMARVSVLDFRIETTNDNPQTPPETPSATSTRGGPVNPGQNRRQN